MAHTYLLGGSQLELRSLPMTNAIPKYTLLKKPPFNAVIVMGAEHWSFCCASNPSLTLRLQRNVNYLTRPRQSQPF